MAVSLNLKFKSSINRIKRRFTTKRKPGNVRYTKPGIVEDKNRKNGNPKSTIKLTKNKWLITIVLVLLVSLIFYELINYSVFFSKLKLNRHEFDTTQELDYWNGKRRINIAIVGLDRKDTGHTFVDRVVILHVNPDLKKLGIFSVNTNFISNYPNDTKGTLKNSYQAGLAENKPLDYTIYASESLLGIMIERYIVINDEQIESLLSNLPTPKIDITEDIVDSDFPTIKSGTYHLTSSQLIDYIGTESMGEDYKMSHLVNLLKDMSKEVNDISVFFNIKKYISIVAENLDTNLSKREVLNLSLFIRGLRSDQIKIAYTRESGGLKDSLNPEMWEPDYDSIDNDLKAIFENPNVRIEQAKVEVLNATDIAGLATSKARLLENVGCRIVRTGNTSEHVEYTTVYVQNPKAYTETIKEIKADFEEKVVILEVEYPYRHIGDLVLVIASK